MPDGPDGGPTYQFNQMPAENKIANKFLNYLLKGDSHSARQLIFSAVEEGFPVKRIYLEVFQWSQREIGHLWETNQINVADEHFSTAATQTIMAQLYPYITTTSQKHKKAIITCVPGELHEIGARMVADFLTMGGWDAYYLGANTPTESLIQKIQSTDPDLVCISVTMTHHVPQLMDLIAQIRSRLNNPKMKLMVGGRPFLVSPNLCFSFQNVDSCLDDVTSVVDFANKLVMKEDS